MAAANRGVGGSFPRDVVGQRHADHGPAGPLAAGSAPARQGRGPGVGEPDAAAEGGRETFSTGPAPPGGSVRRRRPTGSLEGAWQVKESSAPC